MDSLYQLNVGLNKNYDAWLNDLIKISSIQLFTHVAQTLMSGKPKDLFNKNFLQGFAIVLLAFSFYWLVAKKLVQFRHNNEKK